MATHRDKFNFSRKTTVLDAVENTGSMQLNGVLRLRVVEGAVAKEMIQLTQHTGWTPQYCGGLSLNLMQ